MTWSQVSMKEKAKEVDRMSGDAEALSECEVKTDETRSHRRPGTYLWVGMSRNWSVFQEKALGLRIATGCTSDTNINHIHDETKILPIEKHLRLHSSQL